MSSDGKVESVTATFIIPSHEAARETDVNISTPAPAILGPTLCVDQIARSF